MQSSRLVLSSRSALDSRLLTLTALWLVGMLLSVQAPAQQTITDIAEEELREVLPTAHRFEFVEGDMPVYSAYGDVDGEEGLVGQARRAEQYRGHGDRWGPMSAPGGVGAGEGNDEVEGEERLHVVVPTRASVVYLVLRPVGQIGSGTVDVEGCLHGCW